MDRCWRGLGRWPVAPRHRGYSDLRKQIPFHRPAVERIQDDVAAISVEKRTVVAAVRVGEYGAVAARQRARQEFAYGRRFAGAGRADELEVLGLVARWESESPPESIIRARYLAPARRGAVGPLRPSIARRAYGFPPNAARTCWKGDKSKRQGGREHDRPAVGMVLIARGHCMRSIPVHDVIIGFLAVGRGAAIDANAQSRRLAATSPIRPGLPVA